MSAVLLALRVEVTLPNGEQHSLDVATAALFSNCKHCGEEFQLRETDQVYCGEKCRKRAKYLRWKGR